MNSLRGKGLAILAIVLCVVYFGYRFYVGGIDAAVLQEEAVEVRLADVPVLREARNVDAGVVDHGDVVRGNARMTDAHGGRDDRDGQHESRAEQDRQIALREETALHRGGSIAAIT